MSFYTEDLLQSCELVAAAYIHEIDGSIPRGAQMRRLIEYALAGEYGQEEGMHIFDRGLQEVIIATARAKGWERA